MQDVGTNLIDGHFVVTFADTSAIRVQDVGTNLIDGHVWRIVAIDAREVQDVGTNLIDGHYSQFGAAAKAEECKTSAPT